MKKYKFSINEKEYNVVVKEVDDDVAEVEVNGTPYSIHIHKKRQTPKTPILVRKDIKTIPGENKVAEKLAPMPISAKPSSKAINSPLPGNVLKISVKAGDTFKEGDVLMVMESMKMENNILAERSGTIIRVCVTVGASVMQDEALFEIQ